MMCSRGQLIGLVGLLFTVAWPSGAATARGGDPPASAEPAASEDAQRVEAEQDRQEAEEALSPESVLQRVETMAMDLRTLPGRDLLRINNIARELARLGPHAIDPLLDLMTDPVSMAREAAVTAIEQLHPERALPDLIACLGDESPAVAMAAVIAVASYRTPWATRALVRWLAHPDGAVADAVLSALVARDADTVREVIAALYATPPVEVGSGPYLAAMGRFPTRQTVKLLLKSLNDDAVAIDAIRGLAFYGPKAAKKLGGWIKKNSKSHPAISAGAVAVLAGYGAAGDRVLRTLLPRLSHSLKEQAADALLIETREEARPKVLSRLLVHRDAGLKKVGLERAMTVEGADPRVGMAQNIRFRDPDVRTLTAKALQLVGRDEEVERLLITRYREVARVRTPENLAERELLLEGIGIAGTDQAVTELVQATGQEDEVKAALRGLGLIGERAISALLFVIKTGDPVRTPLAVRALADAGPSALEPLMGLLVHSVRDVRNTARQAVAQIQAIEVVPSVVTLIGEANTPGRVQLVSLLGALYCEESLTALKAIAREDGDHSLREAAVRVLAQMDDPRVYTILKQVATDEPNQDIRYSAVNGLIWQSDLSAVPFLIGLLDYEKDFIRKAVARALGYMAAPTDIQLIEPNLSTPRHEVLSAVRDAMRRITFQRTFDLGDQFVEWSEEYLSEAKEPVELRSGDMTFADGTTMHYWLHGSGEPLLVLPDGPDFSHRYLRPVLDVFAEDRLLIYVDLPGRGVSSGPRDPTIPMGLEHDVQSTATMLARLNLRNVDVYGHGYGAMVAVRLADKHAKLVRTMVLDGNPMPSLQGLQARAAVAASRVPEPWAQDLEWFKVEGPRFHPDVYDRWLNLALMTGAVTEPATLVTLWPYLETNPTTRRAVLGPMGNFDLSEVYARIATPTLMLAGQDAPMDEAGKAWLAGFAEGGAAASKHVTLHTISSAGHFPAFEQNEAWLDAIKDFLP
jgi:pimeloyl-ACP methyl ester carboxylesterase/HEAT repeat protein